MRNASGASAHFLADFYANSNSSKNSDRLNKMYNIGQGGSDDSLSGDAQVILADLDKQLDKHSIPKSHRDCPECKLVMSLLYIGSVEIDYCTRCDSSWFDPGELKAFTGVDKDVPSDNLKSRKSKYHCPECDVQMNELVFLKPYNLLVDSCPYGHGVYLEKGELGRALDVSNPLRGKGLPG